MSNARWESTAVRLYRVALCAYPREFRQAHGDDMEQVFVDAWRDVASPRGAAGRLLFLAGMGLDAIRHAIVAWAQAMGSARRARRTDGGGLRERVSHRGRRLDELSRNVVYAGRSLRRRPGFTAVAVLSLALGIGANLAVFNILERLVLAKLPVKDPDGLYNVVIMQPNRRNDLLSYVKLGQLRDNFDVFDELFGWGGREVEVTAGESTQLRLVVGVTGNYFEALGLRPAMGRLLTPQDEQEGVAEIAVISHRLWQTALSGDPGVVGQRVTVAGKAFVVVGVAPSDFIGTEPSAPPGVYLPIAGYAHVDFAYDRLRNLWFHIMGRLRADVPLATAQAVLEDGWPAVDEPNRVELNRNTYDRVLLEDGSHGYSAARLEFSRAVLVVMGLVAAVFLIACANLATLLFVRGASRTREMSIRTAIGATRPQLVRQWMTECMMIAVLGGLAGLGAATGITDLLLRFLAEPDRPGLRFHAGPTVVLVSIGLTLAAGLLSGLLPGLRATGVRPELRAHSSAVTNRPGSLSQAVLSLQLGVSLVLIVGGALFARTLWNLNTTTGGFARREVVYAVPDFVAGQVTGLQRSAIADEVRDRLRQSALVAAASVGDPPVVFVSGTNYITEVPRYEFGVDEDNSVVMKNVSPGYFNALGVPLLAGRDYEESDRPSGPNPNQLWPVIIVDEPVANRYFSGGDAVGQTIVVNGVPREIIGVVPALRVRSMRDAESGVAYVPLLAQHWDRPGGTAILARPAPGVTPSAVEAELRSAFASVADDVPVTIDRLETAIQGSLGRDRLVARLSAAFALLGVLLAAMGLYASMAYSVTARTRELGIRVALGAESRDVMWTVLRQSLVVTGMGVLIGLPVAVLGSRMISPLLFEVSPSDPWTLGGASALLALSGLAAGWWPARRATRLDPLQTLRCEEG